MMHPRKITLFKILCRQTAAMASLLAVMFASSATADDRNPAQARLELAESYLAEALETSPDALRLSLQARAITSEDRDLFFYSAGTEAGDATWVVLDREGEKIDLAAVEAAEKREFFATAKNHIDEPTGGGCGTITGYKWNDLNGDGIKDPNEPLIPWPIVISNVNSQTSYPPVTAGTSGLFQLSGLPAGTYMVSEIANGNWIQTHPQSGSHLVTLDGCGTEAVFFGNQYLGRCDLGCDVEADCFGGPAGGGIGEFTCRAYPSGVAPFQYHWTVTPAANLVTDNTRVILGDCRLAEPGTPSQTYTATVTMTDACGCVAQDWAEFICDPSGTN